MKLRNYRMSFAMIGLAALGCAATLGPMGAMATEAPKVIIKDFMFTPNNLTIKAGTQVTWVNTDDEPHNVISDTGVFRSGGFDTNESFSYKFDKPGTYHLTCGIHPRMVATIVVE